MARGKFEYWLTEDGLLLLEAWARDGLTLEQIAHNCGCSLTALKDWRKRYPPISTALKKGKEVVDIQVENALLKRALGYSFEETMVEESDDGYKRRVTKKFVPPDVTAQIYWLKNRRPDLWRDKPESEAKTDTSLMQALLEVMKR